MIKIYYRPIKKKELKVLPEFKVGSWVFAEDPTEKEIDELVETFGVEKDLIEDALDPYEVPRVEEEDGTTYVYTRVPFRDKTGLTTLPVLIAVGDGFVLTVAKKHLNFLDRFINNKVDFYTTQKTKLFLQLFFSINEKYANMVTDISRNVRSIRVRVEKVSNKDIVRFIDYETILNDFISALIPTNTILQNLLKGGYFTLYEEDEDLVEDLMLSTGQLTEMSKANLRHITNIRDSYSTIMSNELNRVIKLLTSLTIIFTIPTMVASFFGMNVGIPFANSPIAFFSIFLFTLVISVLLLVVFIRNRWV